MAEQTFKSPGFFEREIEVISRPLVRNTDVPAGIIGPAEKGPAFVPTTVSSATEFFKKFGLPDKNRTAAHAVSEFFSSQGRAATFCRILGTGTSAGNGDVGFAGFKLTGTELTDPTNQNRAKGAVQFISAQHDLDHAEHITLGIFNDNDSITTEMDSNPLNQGGALASTDRTVELVRAMVFLHKDYTMLICNQDELLTDADDDDEAVAHTDGTFKLLIAKVSDIAGANDGAYDATDITPYIVSLDPSSPSYISKVLNTDPFSFTDKRHYLYTDFPVDSAVATTVGKKVAVTRGITLGKYEDFSSRFSTPQSPSFISQPFGGVEYDLFHFEALDDGAYASGKYKISIANLRASTEKNYLYGTFTVQLRDLMDTDDSPVIYESYSNCTLDPNADNFVARVIGDQKIRLSLDVDSDDEKRLVREGTFANISDRIRIVMSDAILRDEVPVEALPFGFRGIPSLRTTSDGKDDRAANSSLVEGQDLTEDKLVKSILPPLPYRMKVTRGDVRKSNSTGNKIYFQTYLGQVLNSGAQQNSELVSSSLYWGLHNTRVSDINNPNSGNLSQDFNKLILSLTKFLGKSTSHTISGSDADDFNSNKFSLAKVAFSSSSLSDISGTISDAFLEAVYVRNADVGSSLYDAVTNQIKMSSSVDPFNLEDDADDAADTKVLRATFAKLLGEDPKKFNKYSLMAKFTAPFYGGFDGVNILNKEDYYFTDRASSIDTDGHAADGGYPSGLAGTSDSSVQGSELQNNAVLSYKNAVLVMTDEMIVDHNILVVPGIRDSLITDYASRRVKNYGKALYVMDIPHYASDDSRIFVSPEGLASGRPDVDVTSSAFDTREVDSSYVATYFPDVMIVDSGDDENARQTNARLKRVPSSVVALGALALTDRINAPWFAPAGFTRGALSNVKSTDVRLNAADRDTLYEARINPIANFPNNQFVIFGQKTTQIARTALDRVNVRRLMVRIKRRIQKIAQGLLFEQNDAQTRARFIAATSQELASVQSQQGIEDFRVIMDDSNNTAEDVDNNRLNGKIIVVPTRAVEFIAMDFIITNSGVEFPS